LKSWLAWYAGADLERFDLFECRLFDFFAVGRLRRPAAPKKTARQFAPAGSNPKETLINPL
jgi:hypothetical protein